VRFAVLPLLNLDYVVNLCITFGYASVTEDTIVEKRCSRERYGRWQQWRFEYRMEGGCTPKTIMSMLADRKIEEGSMHHFPGEKKLL
jgi:hypothetical protein